MKKLLTLMIGFGLVLGTAFAAPPAQKEEPKKEAKKKGNRGKHKGEVKGEHKGDTQKAPEKK